MDAASGGSAWHRTACRRPQRELDVATEGALPHGGSDARIQGLLVAAAGLRLGAKRSLSPSRRSTERNHKVDAPVPATTSAAVATVESIRNRLAGSVTISTARPAV